MNHREILKKVGVRDSKIDDCLFWAFGSNVGTQQLEDFAGTWNARHKQLFEVRESEDLEKVMMKIGTVYNNLFTVQACR